MDRGDRLGSGGRRRAAALLVVPALCALAGCDALVYVAHVAEGQLAIQGRTEPIDAVLASGRLSEDEQTKLRLLVRARDFAAEVIGLEVGDSYTTFYDTGDDPLAFNLSAAYRDALRPYTWFFPVVGEVPYLGFFDESYMRAVEEQLQARGLDTFSYELDAYSTLGLFDDPVRSSMLRRGTLSLVETVIHELVHNTIWRPGATEFNESLATFVGRQGAIEFLRAEFGEESGWPAAAAAYYADTDAVNAFLFELYHELERYYAQPLDSASKIAGREAVYQAARERFAQQILPTLNYPESFAGYAELPTNNAWLLGHCRYNLDLSLFEEIYAAAGQDWTSALAVFREAAAAPGDPFDYLRDLLNRLPAAPAEAGGS